MFQTLVTNVSLFPKDDEGALSTLIRKLKLKIIPAGEFIIQEREIATEMFFIVKGEVAVMKREEGVILTSLEVGQSFGEMALIESGNTRNASVKAITNVSVAILTSKDFQIIREMYPEFNQKIQDIIKARKIDTDNTTRRVSREHNKKNHLSKLSEIIEESKRNSILERSSITQKKN